MENLYNKYRPSKWSEVVGQDAVIKILSRQIEIDDIKNCIIMSGASGCGKTTVARLFANEINRGQGNPIEIDAASNNGVDNVKQIVASASERAIDSKYKVYIIDEAHSLTSQAWQSFLKCIEEPPLYTIFIFCTTDPQKIPDTIKNRCMRFNFSRISSSLINMRLVEVCNKEEFTNFTETCDYISRICNGEMRNALSLLETCASYDTNLSIDVALKALGNMSYDLYFDLVNGIIDGNNVGVFNNLQNIINSGVDLKRFINDFISFCLDVTRYSLTGSIQETKIPNSYEEKLKFAVGFNEPSKYYFYIIDKLLELKNMIKTDQDAKSTIMVVFSQMCRLK